MGGGGERESKSYQNTIEGTWIASTLHMTQHGDTCILIQLWNDRFTHLFSCDRIAITIDGTFSDNNDI